MRIFDSYVQPLHFSLAPVRLITVLCFTHTLMSKELSISLSPLLVSVCDIYLSGNNGQSERFENDASLFPAGFGHLCALPSFSDKSFVFQIAG